MLRLDLSAEGRWFDLGHGVRVKCDAATTPVMAAARKDEAVTSLPPTASQEDLGIAMSRAVARRIIREWEGVGDVNGDPVPVTDEWINRLLDQWPMFEAFQAKVLAGAMLIDAEKNGSAPSPNGTSTGAGTTARAARGSAKSARKGSTRRKA